MPAVLCDKYSIAWFLNIFDSSNNDKNKAAKYEILKMNIFVLFSFPKTIIKRKTNLNTELCNSKPNNIAITKVNTV